MCRQDFAPNIHESFSAQRCCGLQTKMDQQTILTDYFTAAKSRQGFQPAKRRKIVTGSEELPRMKSFKPVDGISGLESQAKSQVCKGTPTASSRTKDSKRSSKSRHRPCRKTRQNDILDKDIADIIRAEPTSLKDDHEADRPRKEPAKPTIVGNISRDDMHNSAAVKKNSGEQKPSSGGEASENTKAQPKNSGVPQKSGLKVNPWISEQAKLVLATRGRRALEKSLDKSHSIIPRAVGQRDNAKVQSKEKVAAKQERPAGTTIPRLHQGITPSNPISKSCLEPSGSQLPAYKRFSHLLEAKKPKESEVTRNLPLPYHFKVLEEMFRCVDVVLSLKQKRYETCTFEKLKESVQEMCRKKFEKKHLAQMKTVYPTAFVFRQQNGVQGLRKSQFQLTIDFNMAELENQPRKECKYVESSALITRQKHFKQELSRITMKHHCDFLAKNHPSLSVDDAAIMRWHPHFRVDEVPEISLSPLPEPPQVKTYSTAQDVLDQARQNIAPRVKKSLKLVAEKSKKWKINNPEKKDSQSKLQNPGLKGISQSLIEKIRQKEEKKIQESLTVNPDVVRKRVMVKRLPELCRILRTYFVSEHRAAIPLEDASNKLAESCTSALSSVQVQKHLTLLSELAPEWLSITYVRKCPYVKLKKNVNINNLVEKLKLKEIN